MNLARQVFHVRFGESGATVELLQELLDRFMPSTSGRILTDISGRDFMVVLEYEAENLMAWEQLRQRVYSDPDFGEWFGRFSGYVKTSFTELYTIEHRRDSS
jgi:hypothetical protein